MIVIDGGECKSVNEEGVVVGLGIVFGSSAEPDQSKERDFFTVDSFIQKKTSFDVPLYHNHGFPIKHQIGEATLTKTETGWNAEARIDLEDELGKQIYKTVKSNPYGFSTGALSHLVEREAKENNTNFLSMWPVGELSLTPRPAERKAIVQAVKSINDEGEAEFGPVWTDEVEASATLVAIYGEDGQKIWDAEDATKDLSDLTEKVKKIELKFTNAYGSVTYDVSLYDSETDTGTSIVMYEYGGVEDLINHLQDVVSKASAAVKSENKGEPTLEDKIKNIVKTMLPAKEGDNDNEVSELKSQLQEMQDKLATAEQRASDSETNLTDANEKIARLEILAGASKTIQKIKGK